MPGAMENLGVLVRNENNELVPSDGARREFVKTNEKIREKGHNDSPFPCAPKVQPLDTQVDLNDKERFKSWHDRWIDGIYLDVLKTLNTEPQFAIPIFDPTGVAAKLGMEAPDLSLFSIVSAFAAPQAFVPSLLNVKSENIPDFLSKMMGLIQPPKIPVPDIPSPPKIGDKNLYVGLDSPDFPNFPSVYGFNVSFLTNLPNAFQEMLKTLIDPNWWLTFSPGSLFEAGCQSVQKIMPQPQTTYPTTFDTNVATLLTATGPAIAAAVASSTIGATTLLVKLGEQLGYRTKPVTEKENLDDVATINGLIKIQPNERNMVLPLYFRKTFYGDHLVVEMLNRLADHMWSDTSYRKEGEEPYTLEVGNITNAVRDISARRPGNPYYSESHAGMSFDLAYPMKKNDSWLSGFKDKFTEKSSNPFRGEMEVPSMINAKLTHDFPTIYEIGRWLFEDYVINLIENNRLINWNMSNKRIRSPFDFICLGPKIYSEFIKWGNKTHGKNFNMKKKFLKSSAKLDKIKDEDYLIATSGLPIWISQKNHEDHMHFVCVRTRVITEDYKKEYKKINKNFIFPESKDRNYPNVHRVAYQKESDFPYDIIQVNDPNDLTTDEKKKRKITAYI